MVASFYWKNHKLADSLFAALLVTAMWLVGRKGYGIFVVDGMSIKQMAVAWLGPTLSLFGLFSATIAFMFTVIDKQEFSLIKKSKSQAQLWQIFQGNLIWLCAAAFCSLALAICDVSIANNFATQVICSYIIIMVLIGLVKFTWVMTQIVSVRVAHARP